jgi:hypothetical protein
VAHNASAPILPADRPDVEERGEEHVCRAGTKLDCALRACPAVDPTGKRYLIAVEVELVGGVFAGPAGSAVVSVIILILPELPPRARCHRPQQAPCCDWGLQRLSPPAPTLPAGAVHSSVKSTVRVRRRRAGLSPGAAPLSRERRVRDPGNGTKERPRQPGLGHLCRGSGCCGHSSSQRTGRPVQRRPTKTGSLSHPELAFPLPAYDRTIGCKAHL